MGQPSHRAGETPVRVRAVEGYRGAERPAAVEVGGRFVEVAAVEEQWAEAGRDPTEASRRVFRVRLEDGSRLILVHREGRGWFREGPATAGDGVRFEPWSRARHGDGHCGVIEEVYREYGFTWDLSHPYFADLVDPESHYDRAGGFFEVAVSEGAVVGTIGGTHEGSEWELHRLYVRPSCRRRGIGSALVRRFLDRVRAGGATRVVLWSDKKLKDAHRLYESLGFRTIGDRVCPDPDRAEEWGMELRL
ncbi:MAG: GNAT family N-acetyltransferase [Planctomycetales bacterium]|nr:GNAT family N-acetyltransferase [Planctomycetales bacterium]